MTVSVVLRLSMLKMYVIMMEIVMVVYCENLWGTQCTSSLCEHRHKLPVHKLMQRHSCYQARAGGGGRQVHCPRSWSVRLAAVPRQGPAVFLFEFILSTLPPPGLKQALQRPACYCRNVKPVALQMCHPQLCFERLEGGETP